MEKHIEFLGIDGNGRGHYISDNGGESTYDPRNGFSNLILAGYPLVSEIKITRGEHGSLRRYTDGELKTIAEDIRYTAKDLKKNVLVELKL